MLTFCFKLLGGSIGCALAPYILGSYFLGRHLKIVAILRYLYFPVTVCSIYFMGLMHRLLAKERGLPLKVFTIDEGT